MKINLRELAEALAAVEGKQTFTFNTVPDYVLKHIYEPLSRGEPVLFADLDFEAFSDEDLNVLDDWVNEQQYAFSRLCKLNEHFSNAVPVSAAARAFC